MEREVDPLTCLFGMGFSQIDCLLQLASSVARDLANCIEDDPQLAEILNTISQKARDTNEFMSRELKTLVAKPDNELEPLEGNDG